VQRGGHLSLEARHKLSEIRMGRKPTIETRHKMSESAKQRAFDTRRKTAETRRKMSEAAKGRQFTLETRQKMSEAAKRFAQEHPEVALRVAGHWKGKSHSFSTRLKLSEIHKGSKNWNWKGGVFPRNRNSIALKDWRRSVLKRDDYTCTECGQRGGKLNAHHIESWALHPTKRYDVGNGTVLCIRCHGKQHRKGESNESALSA
jgi:hypothetical protein